MGPVRWSSSQPDVRHIDVARNGQEHSMKTRLAFPIIGIIGIVGIVGTAAAIGLSTNATPAIAGNGHGNGHWHGNGHGNGHPGENGCNDPYPGGYEGFVVAMATGSLPRPTATSSMGRISTKRSWAGRAQRSLRIEQTPSRSFRRSSASPMPPITRIRFL